MDNKEIIKSNNNTLRKAKGFPSATSIWNNSIYSFNQNYLKNIPSADTIVNKIIKSFFTISPLDINPTGKKAKLVQRRFLRLSLNKILVSKSEIKHTNDKVFITVYLFNKKKRSLLLKLKNIGKNLLNSLYLKKAYNPYLSSAQNLGQASPAPKNNTDLSTTTKVKNTKVKNERARAQDYFCNKSNSAFNVSNISSNKAKTSIILHKVIINKYAFMQKNQYLPISKTSSINNVKKKKYINLITFNDKNKYINNLSYYKQLNNIVKNNIYLFINSMAGKVDNKNVNTLFNDVFAEQVNLGGVHLTLKNLFIFVNKYKLYDLEQVKPAGDNKKSNKRKIYKNTKPNYSIHKLLSVYKLFSLYNNINLQNKYGTSIESKKIKLNDFLPQENNVTFSKKVIYNTYKLLRKSYINLNVRVNLIKPENIKTNIKKKIKGLNNMSYAYLTQNTNSIGLKAKHRNNKSKKLGLNTYFALNKTRLSGKTHNISKSSITYINLKRIIRNVVLINKLNRIDRFFNKYKNIFMLSQKVNKGIFLNKDILSISNNYKVNFINQLLEKEIIYVYYLKLLSYNDAIFKNWFLHSLKDLISKIYNKKVILNLVNLKYIHLNSDILSEAVNIRLRNFKKNRVVKVLKKAIKLVPISKINIYACDQYSESYKYVNNFNNNFLNLKKDIFQELGLVYNAEKRYKSLLNNSSNKYKSITLFSRLNHIQASTINFIKYKSVFGVRLEAAGRLTKRSTASRSIFKYRYNGTLRNNNIINNSISSVIVKNNSLSNLQITKITSKTRNGSFGLKGWINNN